MICRAIGEPASQQSLLRQRVQIPTDEEDYALIKAAQAGDNDARNELVVRHLPAIIKYASRYHAIRHRQRHVELEDLIHVAVFGVMHAIRKYERKKRAGGRFLTYATYWMRTYMDKAINEYRMFRIPMSTEYAYKVGRLTKSETKIAIERFHHIRFFEDGNDERVLDHRLTPEEEAIFREEYQNARASQRKCKAPKRRKERTTPFLFRRESRTKTTNCKTRRKNSSTRRAHQDPT